LKIREVQTEDFYEWLRMRHALWPEHTLKELFSEMVVIFKGGRISDELEWVVFVIEKENGLGKIG
jgi:hypothetical protein